MIASVLAELRHKLVAAETHRVAFQVLLALPEARPGFSDSDARWIANAVGAATRDFATRVEVVGRGHAGAVRAVEQVARECSDRRDELFLVVGADSYLLMCPDECPPQCSHQSPGQGVCKIC